MDLAAILDYEMTPDEAQAYKIALLWEKMAPEHFPNYKHAAIRKRGDPRKSNLFRVGWTLLEKTRGVLSPGEYKYYILAQLAMFKELNKEYGDIMLTPQCLLGDKAWVRWKIWKKKLDTACKNRMTESLNIKMSEDKLKTELGRSRQFLMQCFDGTWTKEKLLGHTTDMLRWVASTKVSPYYMALSPWCAGLSEEQQPLDLTIYKNQLGPEAARLFGEFFPEEK